MKDRDIISVYGSIESARRNASMKYFAKEVLKEENYKKFINSYRFLFWAQLLGIIFGFLIPALVAYLVTGGDKNALYYGVIIGFPWMIIWLFVSNYLPPSRVYRKFAKWFRQEHADIEELNEIF